MNPNATTPRIADLVLCSSRRHREEAGIELDIGLYLVDRRRDGLVYFARPDRTAWIAKIALMIVEADDPRAIPPPEWVTRVHRAARLLDASTLELDPDAPGGREARLGCAGLGGVQLREIERLAGARADDIRVRPGSMSRIVVVLPLAGPGGGTSGS